MTVLADANIGRLLRKVSGIKHSHTYGTQNESPEPIYVGFSNS